MYNGLPSLPNVIELRALPRSQGPPRPPEVGVRLEAEAPCVVDGAEYEVPGELERDRDSLRLPRSEVLALEGLELALAHPPWPDRVLDPETPCVDEVAAHGQLARVGRARRRARRRRRCRWLHSAHRRRLANQRGRRFAARAASQG